MPYFERPIHCFGGDDSVHPHRPSPVLRPHTKSARAVYQWGYRGYYATAIDIYYRVNILSAGKKCCENIKCIHCLDSNFLEVNAHGANDSHFLHGFKTVASIMDIITKCVDIPYWVV